MAKFIHNGKRKALKVVAHKARAGRSVCVMKPEYLALIENFRLMDDTFMSKCLEHAPECIELTPQEKILVHEYNAQRAVSKDYPCRFDAEGSAVLETLSMELFNKYNPAIGRPEKIRRPIWLILFAVTAIALACTVGYCYF